MSLPKSVQAQAAAAQAHFDKPKNPVDDPVPALGEEAVEPQNVVQSEDTSKNPDGDENSNPEPKKPERSESYWENRFHIINGKYTAEVPALHAEIKTLKQQLQERDSQLQEQAEKAKSTSAAFTEEQLAQFKEDYGEDLVSFVERMVEAKSGPSGEVEQLRAKVSQMEQRDRQSQETLFWSVLSDLVPDWKTVNNDPAFHRYLAEFDPQTGEQRQHKLVDAQSAFDADGVAHLFIEFKKVAASQPRIPEGQIEPDRSRATMVPQGAKIWTRSEITQFYRDKSTGRYSAGEAERLEADIFAAQKQGRIR